MDMAVNNRVKISNDIELKDRLVAINRVTKVTKGGRTFSFSAIVVVGNEDGIIGWGLGKAGEVTAAIAKGVEAAKKNLTRVPVLKGTVPHEQSLLNPLLPEPELLQEVRCVLYWKVLALPMYWLNLRALQILIIW